MASNDIWSNVGASLQKLCVASGRVRVCISPAGITEVVSWIAIVGVVRESVDEANVDDIDRWIFISFVPSRPSFVVLTCDLACLHQSVLIRSLTPVCNYVRLASSVESRRRRRNDAGRKGGRCDERRHAGISEKNECTLRARGLKLK